MKEIGVKGQQALIKAKILIIGAGGLGAPCLMYLAAAGVGTLGIVDHDKVELSNLHRQVIHSESNIGINKAQSAKQFTAGLNSTCQVEAIEVQVTRFNAQQIIERFDIVVDCTDNAPSRYLINDVAVLLNKPLVSASALRTEGQLTVYNHLDGPCYRCLFPVPAQNVVNCSDGGVIGCLVGVLGSMQAAEVVKLIIGLDVLAGKMLLYNCFLNTFRTVTLRKRQAGCLVCSGTITLNDLPDYEAFCGTRACDKAQSLNLLSQQDRITVQEYSLIKDDHVLIDCRDKLQYDVGALSWSVHCQNMELYDGPKDWPIFVICRRGNQSQKAVLALRSRGYTQVKDIIGGMTAWQDEVDPEFPLLR